MGVRTDLHKWDLDHPEERQWDCESHLKEQIQNPKEHYPLAQTRDHERAAEYVCREAYRLKHREESEQLNISEYKRRANHYAIENYDKTLKRVSDQRIYLEARDAWQWELVDAVGLMVQDLGNFLEGPAIDSLLFFLGKPEPQVLPAYNEFHDGGISLLA